MVKNGFDMETITLATGLSDEVIQAIIESEVVG